MEILYHGRQVENNPVHLKRLEIVCNPLCYFSQSGKSQSFTTSDGIMVLKLTKGGHLAILCDVEYDTERPTQPSCII